MRIILPCNTKLENKIKEMIFTQKHGQIQEKGIKMTQSKIEF